MELMILSFALPLNGTHEKNVLALYGTKKTSSVLPLNGTHERELCFISNRTNYKPMIHSFVLPIYGTHESMLCLTS